MSPVWVCGIGGGLALFCNILLVVVMKKTYKDGFPPLDEENDVLNIDGNPIVRQQMVNEYFGN